MFMKEINICSVSFTNLLLVASELSYNGSVQDDRKIGSYNDISKTFFLPLRIVTTVNISTIMSRYRGGVGRRRGFHSVHFDFEEQKSTSRTFFFHYQ